MPITLNYRKSGPMYAKGAHIIIAHGLFGSSSNWNTIAQNLAHTYKVVTVDLRNHGASPHTDEMSYQQMAEDLKQLLETLGIEKASFIGHSMGGKAVMALAKMHPECIQHLIVVDIAPVTYSQSHDQEINAMLKLDCSQITSREDADKALEADIPNSDVRQFLLQNLQLKDEKYQWRINLSAIQKALPDIGSYPTDLKTPDADYPVMFVGGANSEYFEKEHIEAALACFPPAHIIIMPNTGHWLHVEKAEQFSDMVADYVERA